MEAPGLGDGGQGSGVLGAPSGSRRVSNEAVFLLFFSGVMFFYAGMTWHKDTKDNSAIAGEVIAAACFVAAMHVA